MKGILCTRLVTVYSIINTVALVQAGVNDQYMSHKFEHTTLVVGLDHYFFADRRVVRA